MKACTKVSDRGGGRRSDFKWTNRLPHLHTHWVQILNDSKFQADLVSENAIGRNGITDLVTQRNNFLHSKMAKSVVDGGDCRQYIENEKKLIVEICMDARSLDGMFIFIRRSLAEATNATSFIPHIWMSRLKHSLVVFSIIFVYMEHHTVGIYLGRGTHLSRGAVAVVTKDCQLPPKA